MPLFLDPQGEELHAVFTKRRPDLRRHAGEISFPGGRQDPEDADLGETALREAEEEIGLGRSDVRLLGELPAVSTFVTGYEIHPFMGAIPAGLRWSSPRARSTPCSSSRCRRCVRRRPPRESNGGGSRSTPTPTRSPAR